MEHNTSLLFPSNLVYVCIVVQLPEPDYDACRDTVKFLLFSVMSSLHKLNSPLGLDCYLTPLPLPLSLIPNKECSFLHNWMFPAQKLRSSLYECKPSLWLNNAFFGYLNSLQLPSPSFSTLSTIKGNLWSLAQIRTLPTLALKEGLWSWITLFFFSLEGGGERKEKRE